VAEYWGGKAGSSQSEGVQGKVIGRGKETEGVGGNVGREKEDVGKGKGRDAKVNSVTYAG